MAGTRTYAERANPKNHDRGMEEVGLTGLGAQLSNTQLLENELSAAPSDSGTKMSEEPIEVEMGETEQLESGIREPSQSDYPELSNGAKSKDRTRSRSPMKQEENLPAIPPKLPQHTKTLASDSNLGKAFRDQKSFPEKSPEEKVIIASEAQEDGPKPYKSDTFRSNSSNNQQEEFHSANEESTGTMEDKFQASKTECEILRARVFQLEKELKETQDFVFSMQPRAAKLTESDALADFNSLWRSVDEWVQTKLGDTIELMTLGKERVPLGQPTKILLSIVPPPGREAFKYRETDEYNVTAVIMRCIADWVLDRDFYCNIEKGAMDFLSSIEKGMRNLEPRRDHITCRTWRAETYLAITNRQSFEVFRSKLRDQVAYDLTHILHIFAPKSDQQEFGRSIIKDIVEPALNLAHKIHLSVDKYSIRWSPYHTATWEQRQTMALDLSQFECVDLISGRTIKFPAKGKNITYLFDLSPGLVLEVAQAQYFGEPKILRRPRILVAATKEEDGFFDPQLPRAGDPFTLLGWMEERIQAKNRSFFG